MSSLFLRFSYYTLLFLFVAQTLLGIYFTATTQTTGLISNNFSFFTIFVRILFIPIILGPWIEELQFRSIFANSERYSQYLWTIIIHLGVTVFLRLVLGIYISSDLTAFLVDFGWSSQIASSLSILFTSLFSLISFYVLLDFASFFSKLKVIPNKFLIPALTVLFVLIHDDVFLSIWYQEFPNLFRVVGLCVGALLFTHIAYRYSLRRAVAVHAVANLAGSFSELKEILTPALPTYLLTISITVIFGLTIYSISDY